MIESGSFKKSTPRTPLPAAVLGTIKRHGCSVLPAFRDQYSVIQGDQVVFIGQVAEVRQWLADTFPNANRRTDRQPLK